MPRHDHLLHIYTYTILIGMSTALAAVDQDAIHQADQALNEALYEEAAALYQKALESPELETPLKTALKYRLALTYSETAQPKEALAALQSIPEPLNQQTRLLKSQMEQQLGLYEQALETLSPLPADQDTQLIRGKILYQMGNIPASRTCFCMLPQPQAQLYLARIEIELGEYPSAAQRLANLSNQVSVKDFLHYEISFIEGDLLFRLHDYAKALKAYEKAIPERNAEKAPWHASTLFQLALCSQHLAEETHEEQRFQQAETLFQTLCTSYPSEQASLALAHCLLSRCACLQDLDAYQRAKALFPYSERNRYYTQMIANPQVTVQTPYPISAEREASDEQLHSQAIFIISSQESTERGAAAIENRDEGIAPAISEERFSIDALRSRPIPDEIMKIAHSQALFLRGLNELQEAKALLHSSHPQEAEAYLRRSLADLSRSYSVFSDHGEILQCLTLCLSYLQGTDWQVEALQLIENHLSRISDDEQLLFLKGQLMTHCPNVAPDTVCAALYAVVSHYPQGHYADTALYTLGLWQIQHEKLKEAESTLLNLQQAYPQSPYAAESLFWAADCSERTNSDRGQTQQLLAKLFEQYPLSPWAGEAYFAYYSYEDYIVGTQESIGHLQRMPSRFPSSPYLITAYYLLGKYACQQHHLNHSRHWNEAIEKWQKAEALFDQLYQNGLIPPHQIEYFAGLRYRAALERAQANLNIALESIGAKRQICIAYSTSAYNDIWNALNGEPFAKGSGEGVIPGETLRYLMEECRYGLAQVYLKSESPLAAQQLLQQMVDQYCGEAITRGYYLSRAHTDLATLAMKRGDYSEALQQLAAAEEAAKGRILNTDERLELWMQQSLCHEALGSLDTAMRLLSKVINDECISGLRLKAMLKRAEIYEKQDRVDLAQKQLIALTRKGGEWAIKAQEKLVRDYDYH